MIIQIFQHLPTLPKAGIFCPLPILCVAFLAFIPDRSVSHCFPLSCLSMFRPLVPMHKSAHSAAHPAAPPSRTLTPHTNSQHTPTHRHPPSHFPHRPPDASAKGQRTHPQHCTACHAPNPHSHANHTAHPHTSTRRPASRTGHRTPAPGAAHPHPPLYSLLLL